MRRYIYELGLKSKRSDKKEDGRTPGGTVALRNTERDAVLLSVMQGYVIFVLVKWSVRAFQSFIMRGNPLG
jgi:hypothetical protein